MRLTVLDHPLVSHKLTVLRDRETSSPVFRQLVEELVTLIAYEAASRRNASAWWGQRFLTTTLPTE